jgi:hypothetical protein
MLTATHYSRRRHGHLGLLQPALNALYQPVLAPATSVDSGGTYIPVKSPDIYVPPAPTGGGTPTTTTTTTTVKSMFNESLLYQSPAPAPPPTSPLDTSNQLAPPSYTPPVATQPTVSVQPEALPPTPYTPPTSVSPTSDPRCMRTPPPSDCPQAAGTFVPSYTSMTPPSDSGPTSTQPTVSVVTPPSMTEAFTTVKRYWPWAAAAAVVGIVLLVRR